MLTFLLIVFVLALALAPLLHFLPSRRQRKLARLREYAAVHGLFVEFRQAPDGGEGTRPVRDLIYYGKRFPTSRNCTVDSAAWIKPATGWRSAGLRRPLPAPLAELTVEIIAASVDQFSCGVYWTEDAEEEGVEQIRQCLERWCELLMQ
jgi:hypothetical protein